MDKSKVKIEDTKVKLKAKIGGPTLNGLRENSSRSFKDVIKDVGINEFLLKRIQNRNTINS